MAETITTALFGQAATGAAAAAAASAGTAATAGLLGYGGSITLVSV
jgi:hypothetical protein